MSFHQLNILTLIVHYFFSFIHVVIVPTTKPTTRPILTPSIQTVAMTTPPPTTEGALSIQPVTTKGSTIHSVTTKAPPPKKKNCIGVIRPTLKILPTLELFFILHNFHKKL